MAERKDGVFRIQNKYLALTYKSHIDRTQLYLFVQAKFPAYEIEFFAAAHEKGDEDCPYPHTHAAVKFKKNAQSTNARILDYPCDVAIHESGFIHPYIGTKRGMLKNDRDWRAWLGYLSKEDPFCEYLKEFKLTAVERVWQAETVQEAIAGCKRLSDVSGAVAAYNMKPEPEIEYLEQWKPWGWQLDFMHLASTPPDPRKIWWFYDNDNGPNGTGGNIGKSMLIKWLNYKWPEYFHVTQGIQYYDHFVENIKNARASGWNGHCLVINLTRTFEMDKGGAWIWQVLESCKDGMHTTKKYSGSTFIMGNTHVIVFANHEANIRGPPPVDVNGHQLRYADGSLIPGKLHLSEDRLNHYKIRVDPNLRDPNPPCVIKKKLPNFLRDRDDQEDEKVDVAPVMAPVMVAVMAPVVVEPPAFVPRAEDIQARDANGDLVLTKVQKDRLNRINELINEQMEYQDNYG